MTFLFPSRDIGHHSISSFMDTRLCCTERTNSCLHWIFVSCALKDHINPSFPAVWGHPGWSHTAVPLSMSVSHTGQVFCSPVFCFNMAKCNVFLELFYWILGYNPIQCLPGYVLNPEVLWSASSNTVHFRLYWDIIKVKY